VPRTQLIDAMNCNPQCSNSSDQAQSRPTPKSPPITLLKSDYPDVKYWEKQHKNVVQISAIEVCDADSSDSDQESTDNKKEESGIQFLEDKHGNAIDHDKRKRLYAELQGFWNDNIDANCPPNNWSSAGSALRDRFRDAIKEKYPFLQFCAGRWKVDVLWKKNYHSWKRSLLSRQSKKKTPLGTGDSNDGGKRKQKDSPEPTDPHEEADELLDMPRLKKVKKGTTSILAMSQSQKVRQLFADSHFIIRKQGSIRTTGDAGFT